MNAEARGISVWSSLRTYMSAGSIIYHRALRNLLYGLNCIHCLGWFRWLLAKTGHKGVWKCWERGFQPLAVGRCQILNRYQELFTYCVIGCAGASLDFAVYAALTSWTCVHYQLANFFGVSSGIVNNFFLNFFFNFKVKDKVFVRLMSFYVVGMFGWALSAGSLWFFIEQMGMNALLAKFGTIFLVTIVQFSLNKTITFRRAAMRIADR